MNTLCYVHIKHYRSLDNVEVNLDCRYECHYDLRTKVLRIKKRKGLPDNFWGKRVHILSAIVGNNGTGKSSTLAFLLQDVVEGATGNDGLGVYVFERGNSLYYYGDVSGIETSISGILCAREAPQITSFYYSGHFMPYVTTNDLRCFELGGSYNATDGWLLIKDLLSYSNMDSLTLDNTIRDHLTSHISQNNYRVCRLLADRTVRKSFSGFELPRYVLIGPNKSGEIAIQKDKKRFADVAVPEFNSRLFAGLTTGSISGWIYYNLLNLYTDGEFEKSPSIFALISRWCEVTKEPHEDYLEKFKEMIASNNTLTCYERVAIEEMIEILSFVSINTCHEQDIFGDTLMYIDIDNDEDNKLGKIAECISSKRKIVSRFFDFSYVQAINGSECILSSGEQELLNLFSRLYDAIVLQPSKFGKEYIPHLLLLDEAEIGYHPAWQRKFISLIISFLESLDLVKEKFQIVLATHSPFILSDIPSSCVNYYKRVEGKTVSVCSKGKETFATNIFDLYHDSFWLDDGMLGAYAYKRISALVKRLETGDAENAISEIDLIGDDRIRKYLLSLMPESNSAELYNYYTAKIKEIQERQSVERNRHE